MATPSIAMIPSAYADSKVYSVLPNNGDGDFTFNRDSSATRVGQNGLIQTVGYFGSELVTNGDFATNSDWTLETGWTISGGTANFSGGTGNKAMYQAAGITNGKTYKIQYEVSSISAGQVAVRFGGMSGVDEITATTIGTYTGYITATGSANGNIHIEDNDNNFVGSIDNVSVQEVLGDQPRLNYDISNGVVQSCPSLLLEPASTNLVLNSTTGAYGNAPISELITTAPDGTNTAIIPIPDSTADRYKHEITGGTYATGTKLTYSWYSKQISVPDVTYVGNLKMKNLINVTQVGSSIKVKDSINGWAKYSATFDITDGSLQSIIRLYFGEAVGIGNQSVAYWGHQLEPLTYCTSLIPTAGSSQTRAAESCFDAGNAATFNSTEGTIYWEASALADDNTDRRIFLSDGTMNNYEAIGYSRFTGNIVAEMISGGVLQTTDWGATGVTQSNNNKFAFSWGSGTMKFYVNGTQTNTESVTSPTGLNVLEFNTAVDNLFMYCNTKDLRVYNEALTDAQLQTLTTL